MAAQDYYSRADIERIVGKSTFARAQAYCDSIVELSLDEDTLLAKVKGSLPVPYQVTINFLQQPDLSWRTETRCTCQVGQRCKHAAAAMLVALETPQIQAGINPDVLSWTAAFLQQAEGGPTRQSKHSTRKSEVIFYVLHQNRQGICLIDFYKGAADYTGGDETTLKPWSNIEAALRQPYKFIDDDDVAIMRLLWSQRNQTYYPQGFNLEGKHGSDIFSRMLATGRLLYAAQELLLISMGETRMGQLGWRLNESGMAIAVIDVEPRAEVLPLRPPWFIDLQTRTAGNIELPFQTAKVMRLLDLPPLGEADIAVVASVLSEAAPELPVPQGANQIPVIEAPLRPLLRLATVKAEVYNYRGYAFTHQPRQLDVAAPVFCYAQYQLNSEDSNVFITGEDGQTVRVVRQPEAEKKALEALKQLNLKRIPDNKLNTARRQPVPLPWWILESDAQWPDFVTESLDPLRAAGWEIEFVPGFRHRLVDVQSWEADLTPNSQGWLDLDLGIVINGERIPLAPLMADLFNLDARWLDAGKLARIDDKELVYLDMIDENTGEISARIRVDAGRLKPIAQTLIDLFDVIGKERDAPLRVSLLDAARVNAALDTRRWQFRSPESVMAMAQTLSNSQGVQAVAAPQGFKLTLRDYQLHGLAWLQYLREHNLAGILADDMGLGKTAQALAHLLLEKEQGRLTQPALVILPTSLIFNWKAEAARFAPDLRILVLHGVSRKEQFARIAEHDVILTTYPLLWRDEAILAEYEYHSLILDEAQTVKNAASKAAAVVRRIKAAHRLCLTGTPLENHLGELWAQFDFLLPGFLGDAKSFTRQWRTPIEKQGDMLRRDVLAKRLKPFILRRRKEDVAQELPPKTTIVRTVELEGSQRDLYETVRAAMDQRVRDEIANRGFTRSQIVILDALLKLRQVCCDPRLLKIDSAKKVKERAKLDLLMDMLPELVHEGRRILVFSQFTSMLALIEDALKAIKLDYVILTGETKNREAPISRFQTGQVPIFLISLKAGGVGLNLTAADTVIHYDPWWNPAVENQATDRAHRIGQTQSVFVYKLVVAGSIEEKILLLQDKKAQLAAGILSEDANVLAKFSETDLAALLAPLE